MIGGFYGTSRLESIMGFSVRVLEYTFSWGDRGWDYLFLCVCVCGFRLISEIIIIWCLTYYYYYYYFSFSQEPGVERV